jgi:DNA-binding IclR family transcriptional regulator
MDREPDLRAIAHALAVLEEIATCGPGVTARQISANLRISPATTYRILNLLVREEYVVRLGDLSGFALGARIGAIAESTPATGVTRAVAGVVTGLRHELGVAVHLLSVFGIRIRMLDEDPRFPLEHRVHVMNDLSYSAAGLLVAAEDGRPDIETVERDDKDLALAATHVVPRARPGTSSIAVVVRDVDDAMMHIVMACASGDYITTHRTSITNLLIESSRVLSPLLS